MWPADSFSIPHPPRNRKRQDVVCGHGLTRGRARKNRTSKPLTEWASAEENPRGPISFHLNPRKQPSIVPHDSPGVRLSPVSCRGHFHVRRESQSRRKQSWHAGQEYMHSRKTLVGYWNPNPGKEPPTAAFFITPNGASALPAERCEHTSFQPVKSPVFSARKGA